MNWLLALKTIVSLAAAALPILFLTRDWKYRDRRTTEFHSLTKTALVLMSCVPAFSILLL